MREGEYALEKQDIYTYSNNIVRIKSISINIYSL